MRFVVRNMLGVCLAVIFMLGGVSAQTADDGPVEHQKRSMTEVLDTRVTCNSVEAPFVDVLKTLAAQADADLVIDDEGLAKECVNVETPITLRVSNVKLRTALKVLLEPLHLDWSPWDGQLVIHSYNGHGCPERRIYDVTELVIAKVDGRQSNSIQQLIDMLACHRPLSWRANGGPGTRKAQVVGGRVLLIVRHEDHVLEEIDNLVVQLRAIVAGEQPAWCEEAEQADAMLAKQVSVDWKETPLRDVRDFLRETCGREVLLDSWGLDELGITLDTPVTLHAENIRLSELLSRCDLGLTLVVTDDAVWVTSDNDEHRWTSIRVHDISDLAQHPGAASFLADLIVREADPLSWAENGGPGWFTLYEVGEHAVFCASHTDSGHRAVRQVLAELREITSRPLPPELGDIDWDAFEGSYEPSAWESEQQEQDLPWDEAGFAFGMDGGFGEGVYDPHGSYLNQVVAGQVELPQRSMTEVLDTRVTCNSVEAPIIGAIRSICAQADVEVLFDRAGLLRAGIGESTTVTIRASSIKLRTALKAVLGPHDLAWAVRDDRLVIHSSSEDGYQQTRVYDVTDLAIYKVDGYQYDNIAELIDLTTRTIDPLSWQENGGPAALEPISVGGRVLFVVKQSFEYQEEMSDLLRQLRTVAAGKEPAWVKQVEEIDALLAKRVDVDWNETPLIDVCKFLREACERDLLLDEEGLDMDGLTLDTPVTLQATNMRRGVVLKHLENELGITFISTEDAVWVVPSCESLEWTFTRDYDITDFLEPPGAGADLLDLITRVVDPLSWQENGGPGSIEPYETTDRVMLVIKQTEDLHREIRQLLASIRKITSQPLPTEYRDIDWEAAGRHDAYWSPYDADSMDGPYFAPGWENDGGPGWPIPEDSPLITYREELEKLPDDVAAVPVSMRKTLVDGQAEFGCDLYKKLAEGNEDGNLFFSPYSVSTCIAMLQEGAEGETAQEIADALHFTVPPDKLAAANAELQVWLQSELGPDNELEIANGMWIQRDYPIHKTYLSTISDYYRGQVDNVDFANPGPIVQLINQWVESATRGHIPALLDESSINSDTRFILANAVYFKGMWDSPFDSEFTEDEPFKTFDGRADHVPMMHQTMHMACTQRDDFRAVSIPYKHHRFSMTLILPSEEGEQAMRELEATLDAKMLDDIQRHAHYRETHLSMPRLSIESKYPLAGIMQSLGMRRAFDALTAQFGGISDDPNGLYIDWIIHKATLDVDEEGTVATAATAIGGGSGGFSEPPPIVKFRADRPFLLAIRHEASGCLLFLGRIEDAAQAANDQAWEMPEGEDDASSDDDPRSLPGAWDSGGFGDSRGTW